MVVRPSSPARLVLAGVAVLLCLQAALVLVAATGITADLHSTHSFSNNVFGVNFATTDLLNWGSSLNRNGGNAMTNYNWKYDSTNSGQDYYFLNHPVNGNYPYPNGSSNDVLMEQTFNANSNNIYLVTIPTIGHVSAGRGSCCSFPTASYPNQQASASGCGNGVQEPNNVELKSSYGCYTTFGPSDAVAFVAHMRATAGASHFDSHAILQLDNEPDIWSFNHRDVYPNPLTYDALWSYTQSYASALKAAFPNVKIAGPIWCCWCQYLYSTADNCNAGSDYANHGNLYISEWYIQQLNNYKNAHGVQLVDYIDVHLYPGVPADESTQAHQAQFTDEVRSFYDANYKDPSGFPNQAIQLLPRFYGWMNTYGPNLNLGLAVSEFSMGPDNFFSSALATAEVLAIFAQYSVAYAAKWTSPAANTATEQAYKLYLNYDGSNSKVEGVFATTSTTNFPLYTGYTVYNSASGRTFVVVFNKDFTATNANNIVINNAAVTGSPSSFSASIYSMNVNSQTLTSQPANTAYVSGTTITIYGFYTPARSVSLIVLPNTHPK